VDAPSSPAPEALELRLRLPSGARIARVEVAGTGAPVKFDRKTGTILLSGRRGKLELIATIAG